MLAGKYRLISLLGRGGMGSVWRAERLGWHAQVAIKLLNFPATADVQTLARFQREARLVAGLRSIHVVQVLDDGIDSESGAPFIVMELLEGESLAERLSRVGRLRPPVVAQIVSQIARALGRAHEAGLVHRDLKPDNVLLVRNDDEEVVKVLDFGIAKWKGSSHKLSHGTLAGQMLGTPAYMSPEQFTDPAKIDQRADLWSLGVIACECMTGLRPFEGETLVSLAVSICTGEPLVPSRIAPVPEGFDTWMARALAREPRDRFPTARIMAEELRGLSGHMPMLWDSAAAPPPTHATHDHTELEPVLELTRRVRSSAPPERTETTDLESVLPLLKSQPAPAGNRLWFGVVALLAAAAGALTVLAPRIAPTAFEDLSSLIARARGRLAPSAARDQQRRGAAPVFRSTEAASGEGEVQTAVSAATPSAPRSPAVTVDAGALSDAGSSEPRR